MKIFCLLCLLIFLFSLGAFAQDCELKTENYLHFTGFSDDGKYLAFEQYGVHEDPSGLPYSNHKFVDVSKNIFALKQTDFEMNSPEGCDNAKLVATVRKQSSAQAQEKLQKLKIVDGNTGNQVFSNTKNKSNAKTSFKINGIDYELNIIATPYKSKDSNYGADFAKLKVTLKNLKTKSVQILQDDGNYQRGASSYNLREIYFYKGNIAVFIESEFLGFEATRYPIFMAVTGKVK
jgi:predicted secreted protein